MDIERIDELKNEYAQSYLEGMSDDDIYEVAYDSIFDNLSDHEVISWASECNILTEDEDKEEFDEKSN